jgi:hypothetical protein
MSIKYSEQSRIFRDFRSIPYSDYYYLIRFYEQYDQDIDFLPFDEGLIMSYYYANALFETYEYDTHIKTATYILEQSIMHNIRYIDGEDLYMTMLYKKTFAHLKLGEVDKAKKFAIQLVRLEPKNHIYRALLVEYFLEVRPDWIKPTLTISALSTLFGAITTIVFSFFYLYLPQEAIIMPYSLLSLATGGLIATSVGYYRNIIAPSRKILLQANTDKTAKYR